MKKINNLLLTLLVLFVFVETSSARENVLKSGKTITKQRAGAIVKKAAADCANPTEFTQLNVNNVRAGILNGGDMWWDLSNPKYEVPKVEGAQETAKHSIFAGALWIGGIDGSGQLKVAAQTYRQGGNDFWPGPLDETGNVEALTCSNYDRFFEVRSEVIERHRAKFSETVTSIPPSQVDQSLLEWPGQDNEYFGSEIGFNLPVGKVMAPFFDYDGDGIYNPTRGDFPALGECQAQPSNVVPDQMIWWVYNDKGNIHTETNGEAIGLEINATAFAFKTNDEINNMTFYKYIVANKATTNLDSVHFAQWVDPDLGQFQDDYVGCNVEASLGIVYNGDAFDEGGEGYGEEIPMLGVDYFKGPLDEDGEELGMSAFVYYNNDFTDIGNPENASHFYGYMAGVWKNGNPITFGGNGTESGNDPTSYMYPSDPTDNSEDAWSECSVPNDPQDRRFLQVSGPFQLQPNAVNDIIVGVVWVPNVNYPCPSFQPILAADGKAQALFDNCFELLDGPDAPELVIRELDQQLIISIYNIPTSNNYKESYNEVDPLLRGLEDSTYTFQGYKLYQLRDARVSASELDDEDKAKLIYQSDKRDGISDIINYANDPLTGLPAGELKVSGANEGIQHTLVVELDVFNNERIINNKAYHFMAIAYAHNEHVPFEVVGPDETEGQASPYLEGRKNIKRYVAIPHLAAPQQGGTQLNAAYGESVEITTLGGTGNGGLFLELTDESVETILTNGSMPYPVYKAGAGPIDVTIYDPFLITDATYEVNMFDANLGSPILDRNSEWDILNQSTSELYPQDTTKYTFTTGQAIPYFDSPGTGFPPPQGFIVGASHVTGPDPDDNADKTTQEFIGGRVDNSDLINVWLSFVPDVNGSTPLNWVRSGDAEGATDPNDENNTIFEDYDIDTDGIYDNIMDRTMAPYCLTAAEYPGPGLNETINTLSDLMSVDIVLTPDPSKWTKCPVVEMAESEELSSGKVRRHSLRSGASLDKDGTPSTSETGMSYFPGYAIDVETGRRLNMMFGENSFFAGDNGDDMIWNPTNNRIRQVGRDLVLGGMHYVYVMFSSYDEGADLKAKFDDAQLGNIYKDAAWTFIPLLSNAAIEYKTMAEGLIPNETTIRLRVSKPYASYNNDGDETTVLEAPKYRFSFSGKAPVVGDIDLAESALEQIQIVPNPYYAYSSYETAQLDNRIKITNLPNASNITILSLDGTLIRKFETDVGNFDYSKGDLQVNTVEWDLTNSKDVKISSGMYIFHIEVPGVGERTMKWFGVLRPTDLDTF